jgi:transposase
MRGLPIELRERIVRAHFEQGIAVLEIADVFQVSITSVRRFIKLAKAGGSLVPNAPPGGQEKLGEAEFKWLLAEIKQSPFTTSYELTSKYNRKFRANQVHRSTILRAMHKLGFTHKKRLR